ncbi:MAG: SDR family NAD(P)-dependent oxidoreductase [Pseudomonadota bacterium]
MRVIITGASSGIGAALAAEYASSGSSMLLIARNAERLAEVATTARAKGATVELAEISVTDEAAMKAAIEAYDDAAPVDVVISNAGIALGRRGEGPERPGEARKQVDVNLLGMLHTVEPLLDRFQSRQSGRIALISSIAGRRPQADLPTYSATKAAVRGYGEAIRPWLRSHGVSVTVICPGFIKTPMAARHNGPKPFQISAEAAARRMRRAIDRGQGRLTLPTPWQFLLLFEPLLPARISDWFERRSAAVIERE